MAEFYLFFLITFYVASTIASVITHCKIEYNQDEKNLKRFELFFMFVPMINIFVVISLLLSEIRNKKYKIESYKIDNNYLSSVNSTLEGRLEKLKSENIIKSIAIGDTFRIPNTDEWIETCRGKLCKITRITNTHVHHTVEGSDQGYKTKIEVMSDMIFINKKGVMPFRFIK